MQKPLSISRAEFTRKIFDTISEYEGELPPSVMADILEAMTNAAVKAAQAQLEKDIAEYETAMQKEEKSTAPDPVMESIKNGDGISKETPKPGKTPGTTTE